MTGRVDDRAVLALGLTCGFFLADMVMMALDPKQMIKDLGGKEAYIIMWAHHVNL